MKKQDSFALDDFPVGCLVTDSRRRILFSNQYLEKRYGHSPRQLVGKDLLVLLSKASQIMYDSYLLPLIMREGGCDELRLSLVTGAGDVEPVMVSAWREAGNDDRIYWSIGPAARSERLFEELTEARSLLQQKISLLNTLSDTDQLTGLPNRNALTRHLSQKISDNKSDHLAFALAFVDLDGFKEVNDRHGHHMGDKVLRLVAKRMAFNLRSDDLIARFGGDEFVILLHGSFTANLVEESLNRLIRQLTEPFEVDSIPMKITASVGVTLYPQAQEIEPDQLIRQADQAMYQAKLAGRNQLCLFNLDAERYQRDRHEELSAFKTAMAAGEFELYYQPKVNMRTGDVLGAEALLRWNHPTDGLIGPGTFLPSLSDTPTGIALGGWVIETALVQLQQWQHQGLEDLHISVNIAGYHLQHPSFLEDLGDILADFPDVPKHLLEFEVLETSTIEDVNHIGSVLGACRLMGIRVSLDDFGTGYSTLGHLRDLSVDILKIDRSFVQDMLTSAGDLAIIRGVIGFARAFERDLIAEGVETRQHGTRLIELGCDWGQGFYIARPMPARAIKAWVRNWHKSEFNRKFNGNGAHQPAAVKG